jgi:hypothetical protein
LPVKNERTAAITQKSAIGTDWSIDNKMSHVHKSTKKLAGTKSNSDLLMLLKPEDFTQVQAF